MFNRTQIRNTENKEFFILRITDVGTKTLKKSTKRNPKIREELNNTIQMLRTMPKMGKELTSDLYGMRSISSKDGEFRIIYELDISKKQVIVYAVGHRSNVYKNLAIFLNKSMPYSKRKYSALCN